MRRRALLAALASLPGLAGCGLRPLYGPARDGATVAGELAAVRIETPKTPLGWTLADRLARELGVAGAAAARYRLVVELERRRNVLAVQLDDSVTRYELTLIARFRLVELESGHELLRSEDRRVAGYGVLRQPYATLAAERDAERRAAAALARAIRNRLALFFRERAA